MEENERANASFQPVKNLSPRNSMPHNFLGHPLLDGNLLKTILSKVSKLKTFEGLEAEGFPLLNFLPRPIRPF